MVRRAPRQDSGLSCGISACAAGVEAAFRYGSAASQLDGSQTTAVSIVVSCWIRSFVINNLQKAPCSSPDLCDCAEMALGGYLMMVAEADLKGGRHELIAFPVSSTSAAENDSVHRPTSP